MFWGSLARCWMFAFAFLGFIFPCTAREVDNEVVILTTFSQEPLNELIADFKQQYPDADVRIINRRTQSSIQLLSKSYMQDIDLVLSSSPFLMHALSTSRRLTYHTYSDHLPTWLAPYVLPDKERVVTFGYSGAGVVWNDDYLQSNGLSRPTRFEHLIDPSYFGHVTMSTPSRSGTTQMMVESVLAKHGWEKGWAIILNVGANLATISARSFGVSEYVAKGKFGAGPTIDNYALSLQKQFDQVGFSYDDTFTLMPTYVAQIKRDEKDGLAEAFVARLLDGEVQNSFASYAFSKTALNDTTLYSGKNPVLDLQQMVEREWVINLIFDSVITKQLPELKDAWLQLINSENGATSSDTNPAVINKATFGSLRTQLFTLPLTQAEAEKFAKRLAEESDAPSTQQALIAEFTHSLGHKMMRNFERVSVQINQLVSE